ncbi:MAG: SDR family oxidoreductase [Frankiaceae bacterium]|jgi:NAD(P)-dependent dehydrogenase (short-subunit alcohol dehydrogenase family)|nr:SDR family oxidoreductase [Frankiaceae bacterium]
MGILDGRVAIITGGGRGIGQSISKLFAAEGASVIINDLGVATDGTVPDSGPAHDTAAEIVAGGGKALANGGDIADEATGEELVQTAIKEFGKLDIVVNVAGILRDRMIFNLSPEDWDAVIRVHLRGHYSTVRPASAYWREQRNENGHYRIINFSSGSGLHGAPGQPNYAAAKLGIVGLSYSLANALGRYGVTSNAIAPGASTRMTDSIPQDRRRAGLTESTEPNPERSPDNVAPMVAYLASEAADWSTGRTYRCMGYAVGLYNNPEVISEVHSDGAWSLADLQQKVEATFKPIASGPPARS